MTNYYHILGITPQATIEQIKKAYRKKAFLLHPDRNKSADAKDQFVLLNEAYEYLLKTQGTHFDPIKRAQEQAQKQAAYQNYWEEKEREKARTRAREHAKMKYEAYIKSDIYKTTEAINIALDLFTVGILIMILVVLPILTIREYGITGLLYSSIIILPTAPLWIRFFINLFKNIKITKDTSILGGSYQTKILKLTIFVILNIFLFFRITLNTLIELKWIIIIFASSIIIGIGVTYFIKQRYYKYLIKYGLSPFCINILFLINYLFSTNSYKELHSYGYKDRIHSPILTTIHFKNGEYEKYHGIRIIFNAEEVKDYGYVTYTFATGCLGYTVVKDIEFE